MKRRTKIILITAILVLAVAFIYFSFNIPCGTFNYTDKEQDLQIELSIKYEGWSWLDNTHTVGYTIKRKGEIFKSRYETSRVDFHALVVKEKNQDFILLSDGHEKYAKCENGKCGDFRSGYTNANYSRTAPADTIFFTNPPDTIFAETISYILFRNYEFKKIK